MVQITVKCAGVNTIKDINYKFDYEDPKGGGDPLEWILISCGQDGSRSGYNELEHFYNTYLANKIEGLAQQSVAMTALCECCHEISHQNRTHDAFKQCVGQKLGIKID